MGEEALAVESSTTNKKTERPHNVVIIAVVVVAVAIVIAIVIVIVIAILPPKTMWLRTCHL